jgi:hypothetical protein
MPIAYRIDRDRRLVVAAAYGTVTDADVFGYQRDVWSRPDVAGFNELVDMTHAGNIATPGAGRVRDLASLAGSMDAKTRPSRFAIVAPSDVAFGMGRMFQSFRHLAAEGTKEVSVFRTMAEAIAFLDLDGPPDLPRLP